MKNTKRRLSLLQDIQEVVDAIDDRTDAFIVSRSESDKKRKGLAKIIYELKKEKLQRLCLSMNKKYGEHKKS